LVSRLTIVTGKRNTRLQTIKSFHFDIWILGICDSVAPLPLNAFVMQTWGWQHPLHPLVFRTAKAHLEGNNMLVLCDTSSSSWKHS